MRAGRAAGALHDIRQVAEFVWRHPENSAHRFRAMSRLAFWQVWERTARTPRWTELHNGIRIRCYPHSTSASAVYYTRLPDWWEMRFVIDYMSTGGSMLDVGANVGVYSLLAASLGGVKVVAFEPVSSAYDRLAENVAVNGLGGVVTCVHAAVGDTPGSVQVTSNHDTCNHVIGQDANPGGREVEEVDCVRLDDEVNPSVAASLRLVKIDVEGTEPAVIRGAMRLIEERAPALLVEWNAPVELRRLLEPAGYACARYDPADRKVVECGWEWEPPTVENVLLLPDVDAATAACRATAGAGSAGSS